MKKVWQQTKGVEGAKEEDHRNNGSSSAVVNLTAFVVDSARYSHSDPYDAACGHSAYHHGSSSELVDEGSTSESEAELEACISEIDVGSLVIFSIAGSFLGGMSVGFEEEVKGRKTTYENGR